MFSIFGFYKFKKLNNLKKNKSILQLYMAKYQVKGAVILANEGINGTISGKKKNLIKVKKKICTIFQIKSFDNKNNSVSKFQPFHKPIIYQVNAPRITTAQFGAPCSISILTPPVTI